MSNKVLSIKYKCLHPSCVVFCKKGTLDLVESEFLELNAAYKEKDKFKSPKNGCRMGFDQPFKAISISEVSDATCLTKDSGKEKNKSGVDPIRVLKEEHIVLLKKLDELEDLVRKRDIDNLWYKVADIENDIMLHSVEKEEQLLFPYVIKNVPMGIAYINIINEDHREFISLLHSFRCALQEDDILDGIISSVIVNLRHHIQKEDEELFCMVDEVMTEKDKVIIDKGMKKIEKNHIVVEAGDRSKKIVSPHLANREYMNAEIADVKKQSTTDDWSCHC